MTGSEAADPVAATRSAPRWMRWGLIASLALNVLILGAMAGGIYHARRHGPFGEPVTGLSLVGFAAHLPAERRRVIWEATQAERAALRPLRGEVREARAAVRKAVLAEPFDAAAFAQAQARLLDAEIKARTSGQKIFSKVAALLTKEERALYAAQQPPDGRPRAGRAWWRKSVQPDGDDHSEPGRK